jgi:serine protease Do
LDVPGVTLREMIQTDAGINPGSSGGPWFNVLGEVIGMTASMKKDSQNIGFAVPAATLRRLMPAMLDVERVEGFVTGLTVAADGPCRVSGVSRDSPAARAGIQAGDLVVELGGKPTPTALDFHLALVGRKADETLTLGLVRGGKRLDVSLTLERRSKPDGAALLREKLGLAAVPLDDQKAKALSLRVPRGVVITAADSKLFEKLDQQPCTGDVLARINKIRPRDLDHLGLILDRVEPSQKVSMVLLRRRDKTLTRIDIGITLPK